MPALRLRGPELTSSPAGRSNAALALALALAFSLLVPGAAAAAPSSVAAGGHCAAIAHAPETLELLPDMEMAPLYGVTIRRTKDDRKRLRFGTRSFNIGAGPLEVRGSDPQSGRMSMLRQCVYDEAGGSRELDPGSGGMFWSGDGHRHWHIEQFINVELYRLNKVASGRRIRKIGFCLIDLLRTSEPPANTPSARAYDYNACGTSQSAGRVKMGISVGYGDDYQPMIAYQWIDITTLRRGTYRLCATVNPLHQWLESDTANNFFWQDVWINPAKATFRLHASGRTPCGSFAES